MRKDDLNVHFKTETDVAQNLIDDFFLILAVRVSFHRKDFKLRKRWGYGVISEKTESFVSRT